PTAFAFDERPDAERMGKLCRDAPPGRCRQRKGFALYVIRYLCRTRRRARRALPHFGTFGRTRRKRRTGRAARPGNGIQDPAYRTRRTEDRTFVPCRWQG